MIKLAITDQKPALLWDSNTPGLDSATPPQIPTITPYLVEPPPGQQSVGAVIVCPGGAYVGLAPYEGEPVAKWLNSLGLAAFVCTYRVAPYRHPYPSMDAARAVQWVREYGPAAGINPRRVGLLGFSAGGHLVSTVGTHYTAGDPAAADPVARHSSRPDAMILCYPVISFQQYAHLGSAHNLLGPEPLPADLAALSNETQVNAQTPPAFVWHTADDDGVAVQNSLLFAEALAAAKVPFSLHIFPHGRHGLGLATEGPEWAPWTRLCGEWLKESGF